MKKNKINSLPLPVLVVVLAIGLFWVGVDRANAVGNASFPQETTVALDVGNILIAAGSDADSVTTTNTSITVTISSGQSMVLTSAGKLQLSNNGGYGFTCETNRSRLSIVPSATETIIITPLTTTCDSTGSSAGSSSTPTPSSGGGGGGSVTTTPTPTPTPTASPAVSATPTPTPAPSTSSGQATPVSRGFVSLSAVSLKDGDVISTAGSSDPDVYIVNPHGYKRLFLNPAIFGFYGHLGGFSKIKATTSVTRDVFVTSGLFRNCETNDPKVYGVETTGEDTGILHWVNTTGAQAVADDPNFFKKVFCINTNEFNWYKKGANYTSVNQVPDYTRKTTTSSSATPVSTADQYKVVSSVGFLNVRSSASTSGSILGQLDAGEKVTSLGKNGLWHKIMFQGNNGWVHGDYLTKI